MPHFYSSLKWFCMGLDREAKMERERDRRRGSLRFQPAVGQYSLWVEWVPFRATSIVLLWSTCWMSEKRPQCRGGKGDLAYNVVGPFLFASWYWLKRSEERAAYMRPSIVWRWEGWVGFKSHWYECPTPKSPEIYTWPIGGGHKGPKIGARIHTHIQSLSGRRLFHYVVPSL